MSRLRTSVSFFALSSVFAWIASSGVVGIAAARAHTTEFGYAFMVKAARDEDPMLAFSMIAAVLMFVFGLAFLISSMLLQRQPSATSKDNKPETA